MLESKQASAASSPELPRRSIWSAKGDPLRFPMLASDLIVDTVIIGAGITGITTAAQLVRAGKRVAVLEAMKIGHGTTGHSTGNLYAPVDESMSRLGKKWGGDKIRAVVQSRKAAIDLIERNIAEYGLGCEFSRQPWVLYSSQGLRAEIDQIENEYKAAIDTGLAARLTGDLPLPYPVKAALVIENQAQFHPLKYVRQLANAIRSNDCLIFEDSPVLDIDEQQGVVRTASCTVKAEKIVMATHTPKGFNVLQTELGPYREYAVAALLGERQLPGGIFWSAGTPKGSTRLVELQGRPYALMIGEKHKTGQHQDTEAGYLALEASLRARFNVKAIAFQWSAQHYRAADGLPYIGLAPGSSRLYLASGFAADGLTYGTLTAIILADEITGTGSPFSELYSPRRFTPLKSAKNFFKENLNVASFYIKDYAQGAAAKKLAEVAPGEGELVDVDGDKMAVYRDESGRLYILSPVCMHLKCIVHWNRAERSWDCPCHGSRFCYDGKVIEGPALEPLQPYDGTRNDSIHH
ncbi:MAG TPA: FAD-dependent oxidoreductase [Burkholderiaceae bacterium]|nr:FAD-dependent oxidoreductase [Burkholderiaceae bacterium]